MTMMSQNSHRYAAARELQRDRRVLVELEQVEARRRRIGECDDSSLAVEALRRPRRVIAAERRPDRLGFAAYDGVGERFEALGA
jgi:hypothetical protein